MRIDRLHDGTGQPVRATRVLVVSVAPTLAANTPGPVDAAHDFDDPAVVADAPGETVPRQAEQIEPVTGVDEIVRDQLGAKDDRVGHHSTEQADGRSVTGGRRVRPELFLDEFADTVAHSSLGERFEVVQVSVNRLRDVDVDVVCG